MPSISSTLIEQSESFWMQQTQRSSPSSQRPLSHCV